MKKGYIQVYTGDGKGKTTAALGLAIRALGAGLRVYIGQFVKGLYYSELKLFSKWKSTIKIEQFGRGCFIKKQPSKKDIECASKGFEKIKKIIDSKKYDIVILDELSIALYYKLINLGDVIKMLKSKPPSVEIVITGRRAPGEIIEIADLVTDMKEIKHYYNEGIKARVGIEK